MNKVLQADLYRYYSKVDSKTFFKVFLNEPGFRFLFFFRKLRINRKFSPLWIISYLFYRRYFYKFGFQIPINTDIGKGFFMGHFGNVIINGSAKIGQNCNIAHGVTIGMSYRGKSKGCPTIGDYVWIGTGSVIVGNIVIGRNVFISPNSYVNFDVPDNSMVINDYSRIVPKNNATQGYIVNTLDSEL